MQESVLPLVGRKALVVGVETPVGAAIARALGAAGADVGLATMRADAGVLVAKRIQRELEAAGRVAATYAFDVTLGQNVKVSTRQVTKELGGLDILVSAPDRFFAAPLGRTTDSDIQQVMTVNAYAHLFAVRAAADEFRRTGGGRVLLIVHEAAEAGLAGAAAYAAAQAAALNLARSLAEELLPQSVGVDALVVGTTTWVDTEAGTLEPVLPGDAAAVLGRLVVGMLTSDAAITGRLEHLDAHIRQAARGQ